MALFDDMRDLPPPLGTKATDAADYARTLITSKRWTKLDADVLRNHLNALNRLLEQQPL